MSGPKECILSPSDQLDQPLILHKYYLNNTVKTDSSFIAEN